MVSAVLCCILNFMIICTYQELVYLLLDFLILLSAAGITLALFGGVQRYSMDQNKVPVRGDIHVIIVGN